MLYRTLAFVLLSLTVGCSRTEVEKVTGQVLLGDAPMADINVCLYPTKNLNLGVLAAYEVDAEGAFTILPRPDRGQLGLAGEYVALVFDNVSAPPRMHPKYTQVTISPLAVTVGKGVTELEPFRLEPHNYAGLFPKR